MKRVFKIKDRNLYRDRLVSKVFLQVEVIDFYNIHDPVLTEVVFRSILLISLRHHLVLRSLDINKAFLEPMV